MKNQKKIVKGYNKKTDSWHCVSCGMNMGKNNPRQYCEKTYCPFQEFSEDENSNEEDIKKINEMDK